jgi:hypothetical protein
MQFVGPIVDTISNSKEITTVKHHLSMHKPLFLFLYMDGCGPCNSTKPAWNAISSHLPDSFKSGSNAMVVQMNQTLFPFFPGSLGTEPLGFPTFRFIHGSTVEEYEGGRSVQALVQWIQSKSKIHPKPIEKKTRRIYEPKKSKRYHQMTRRNYPKTRKNKNKNKNKRNSRNKKR